MERDPFDVELELLREFFDSWVAFHKAASLGKKRPELRHAAMVLEDCASAVRRFRDPVSIKLDH